MLYICLYFSESQAPTFTASPNVTVYVVEGQISPWNGPTMSGEVHSVSSNLYSLQIR